MDKLPFSVYDFFACLSSGFLVIAAVDYSFNHSSLLSQDHAFFVDLVLVISAYMVGHVVAELASWLYERRLVVKCLGRPLDNLLAKPRAASEWRAVLKSYFAPLPEETRERIQQRAEERGFDGRGEGLFFHCHAIVKSDPVVLGRLSTFLNLYGFARNNSFAALLAVPVLVGGAFFNDHHTGQRLVLAAIALGVAVALFVRYLKFFRLYTVEVLVSYAEAVP